MCLVQRIMKYCLFVKELAVGFKSWPDSLTFHTIMEANCCIRLDLTSVQKEDRIRSFKLLGGWTGSEAKSTLME